MNVVMCTNAYAPVIGGLERSITCFAEDLRTLGHRVLVVTLAFPGAEDSDKTTVRLPAIKEVGGTQFSVKLPVPAGLKERLDGFEPDIVHAHHPFMLGDTALRIARRRALPLVFTHHTLYERYAYLFSRESDMLRRIAMAIATEFANLCDRVIAPTRSIERMIRQRGVCVPIDVVPTGIDVSLYESGRRGAFRDAHGIPGNAFVLGYLGRVVAAKNMAYLGRAAVRFLQAAPAARFLVAGDGEALAPLRRRVRAAGVGDRVVLTGSLEGRAVADAYAAMDLFAFASQTETQGIVLVEAFCAGIPIVSLDASGSRDIIRDGVNGRLLSADTPPERFADVLLEAAGDAGLRRRWSEAARRRARDFERTRCARQLLEAYGRTARSDRASGEDEPRLWAGLQDRFATEWDLFREKLSVLTAAVGGEE
ncbi:MAG: glycosyltransferase [Lentisphaerae bacterium]|nr:glycosyltransferase [Lentisphaerota bacterium]